MPDSGPYEVAAAVGQLTISAQRAIAVVAILVNVLEQKGHNPALPTPAQNAAWHVWRRCAGLCRAPTSARSKGG